MIYIIGKVIHLAVQMYLTSVISMNIKAIILFQTHLQIIVTDAYPDFRPSPVNLRFNIKQTAIATMVAFVVSMSTL